MKALLSIIDHIAPVAPLLTLALLAGFSTLLPNHTQSDPTAIQQKHHVAQAIRRVPWSIGPWNGEPKDVPPEAQKLLRPNALLSRRYTAPGRTPVHILIVHCSDARDMNGHYPPICYPSSGWVQMTVAGSDRDQLILAGRSSPVKVYEFRRVLDRTSDEVIRIFDAFILPDGTVTGDIDDIDKQSDRLAVSVQGIAQLQVITPGYTSLEEARAAANELFAGMSDLFGTLRVEHGTSHGP